MHPGLLPTGTFRKILKQAALSEEAFRPMLGWSRYFHAEHPPVSYWVTFDARTVTRGEGTGRGDSSDGGKCDGTLGRRGRTGRGAEALDRIVLRFEPVSLR
jgi:hypothetical protein